MATYWPNFPLYLNKANIQPSWPNKLRQQRISHMEKNNTISLRARRQFVFYNQENNHHGHKTPNVSKVSLTQTPPPPPPAHYPPEHSLQYNFILLR